MPKEIYHVTKVGGAHLADDGYVAGLARHLQEVTGPRQRTILVHGGGKEIGELHEALAVPFHKQLGLRVTSAESMSLVSMVLCGLVNKRLVAQLTSHGLRTLGICGADMAVMTADFLNHEQLGRVGGPPRVQVDQLAALLETTQVLAVSPVCLAPDGGLLNVNADLAAQALAVALDAQCLDYVTDVDAVRTQNGSALALSAHEIDELVRSAVIEGGMIPKLQASLAALDGGVARVRVGSLQSLTRGTATEVYA